MHEEKNEVEENLDLSEENHEGNEGHSEEGKSGENSEDEIEELEELEGPGHSEENAGEGEVGSGFPTRAIAEFDFAKEFREKERK